MIYMTNVLLDWGLHIQAKIASTQKAELKIKLLDSETISHPWE